MNCCDYECNQGRNCPARKPAKVAPVGQRHLAPAPLPPTRHSHMRHLARVMLGAIVFSVLGVAALIV